MLAQRAEGHKSFRKLIEMFQKETTANLSSLYDRQLRLDSAEFRASLFNFAEQPRRISSHH